MPQAAVASVLVLLALAGIAAPGAHAETIGECGFDPATLTFAGTPLEQTTCLLRKVGPVGERRPQPIPETIRRLMTQTTPPSEAMRAAAIAAFPDPYRSYASDYANDPVSQTEAGLPALYFVIHDTSTPFLAEDPFPEDLDHDPEANSFAPYLAAEPVAHIFLNRAGQIWAGHDLAEPWRATKLESYVIGVPARGRFVHIETVQPRRFIDGFGDLAHTEGPRPGFSDAQYRMLAALYVYASARAGRWLIPAQHNTVDAGIPDAHDDPQNFDLERFAREVERFTAPPRQR